MWVQRVELQPRGTLTSELVVVLGGVAGVFWALLKARGQMWLNNRALDVTLSDFVLSLT